MWIVNLDSSNGILRVKYSPDKMNLIKSRTSGFATVPLAFNPWGDYFILSCIVLFCNFQLWDDEGIWNHTLSMTKTFLGYTAKWLLWPIRTLPVVHSRNVYLTQISLSTKQKHRLKVISVLWDLQWYCNRNSKAMQVSILMGITSTVVQI